MTTIKISQLPDATTPLTGTEIFPLDQDNVTNTSPVTLATGDLITVQVTYTRA